MLPSNTEQTKSIRGMSLVELIVTIFVIALLIAILLPTISGPGHHPRGEIICRTNLKMWGMAMLIYTSDNNNSLFPNVVGGDGISEIPVEGHWAIILEEYIGDNKKYSVCPKAREVNPGFAYGSVDKSYVIGEKGEVRDAERIDRSSYGVNFWLSSLPDDAVNLQGKKAEKFWQNTNSDNQSNIPLFLDAMWYGGAPNYDEGTNSKAFRASEHNGQWLGEEYDMMHFAMDRHSGGVNVSFIDGSVRKVGIKELWELEWHKGYDTDIRNRLDKDFWPDWME